MMFAMPILGIGIMILLYSHDGHKLFIGNKNAASAWY